MESIQVGHLKTNFSSILHQVQENGEMYIIEYGRNHKKVAMLIPYKESLEHKKSRIFGVMKNRASYSMGKGFDMTDDEILGDA